MTTAVKEHPILFTGEMVRAILDGRKTQTRRVVKWPNGADEFCTDPARPWILGFGGGEYDGVSDGLIQVEDAPVVRCCPYGGPGGRLWVREAWAAHFIHDGHPPRKIPNDGRSCIWYRADGEETASRIGGCNSGQRGGVWRPSIFLPRWASRITLEVTDVRVERVQEITTADIWAEGLQIPVNEGVLWRMAPSNPAGKVPGDYLPRGRLFPDQPPVSADEVALAHFADLWDSVNAKRGHSWDTNPWVWVVSFRRADG